MQIIETPIVTDPENQGTLSTIEDKLIEQIDQLLDSGNLEHNYKNFLLSVKAALADLNQVANTSMPLELPDYISLDSKTWKKCTKKLSRGKKSSIILPERNEQSFEQEKSFVLRIPNYQYIKNLSGYEAIKIPIAPRSILKIVDVKNANLDEHDKNLLVNKIISTQILTSYAVSWAPTQVSRDIWQNFFDGHNQTLEGTKFEMYRESQKSNYQIQIEGCSEYPYTMLMDLGASSKQNNTRNAGHFGEGSKIVALVLLRDYSCSRVIYSSTNWELEFFLGPKNETGTQEMLQKLSETKHRSGNRFYIETNDPNIVFHIANGIKLFSSAINTDFQNPTFSCEIGGFKFTPKSSGHVYIAGQRIEISNPTSGAEVNLGFNIWINNKTEAFTCDRERSAIQSHALISHIIKPLIAAMTNQELVDTLHLARELWPKFSEDSYCFFEPIKKSNQVVRCMIESAITRGIKLKFGEKDVSIPNLDSNKITYNELYLLKTNGYTLYDNIFNKIGMVSFDDDFRVRDIHPIFKLNNNEIKKIQILMQATKVIFEQLINLNSSFPIDFFVCNVFNKQIGLFDSGKSLFYRKQISAYAGEFIFLDQFFLNNCNFEKAIKETMILYCQFAGHISTAIASYKLTNLISFTLVSTLSSDARTTLSLLKREWETVSDTFTNERLLDDSEENPYSIKLLFSKLHEQSITIKTDLNEIGFIVLDSYLKYQLRGKYILEIFRKLSKKYDIEPDRVKAVFSQSILTPSFLAKLRNIIGNVFLERASQSAENDILDYLISLKKLPAEYLENSTIVCAKSAKLTYLAPVSARRVISTPSMDDIKQLNGSLEIIVPGTPEKLQSENSTNLKTFEATSDINFDIPYETRIRKSYKVKWPILKTIRDVNQNFFDGHCQTFSGISMKVTRNSGNSHYTFEISGFSEYDYRYLYYIGGSNKSNLQGAAGMFGEGTKITALLLLRDFGATSVVYASKNWSARFSLEENSKSVEKLFITLKKASPIIGSKFIITTENIDLIKSFFDSTLLFRYNGHPDFCQPLYENEQGGFSLVNLEQPGNLYIAGQRYEIDFSANEYDYEDDYEDLDTPEEDITSSPLFGFNVWLNNKPKLNNRDRVGLNSNELISLVIEPILKKAKNLELVGLLFALEPFWDISNQSYTSRVLLPLVAHEVRTRNIVTSFDEQYVALPSSAENKKIEIDYLRSENKTPCPEFMGPLGMNRLPQDLFLEFIEPCESTLIEQQKLKILQVAVQLIVEPLLLNYLNLTAATKSFLSNINLKTKASLYRAKSNTQKIEISIPKAFWFDDHVFVNENMLINNDFTECLAIYLHELTHRYGKDNERIFTLKIAEWIEEIVNCSQDQEFIENFTCLNLAWDILSRSPVVTETH